MRRGPVRWRPTRQRNGVFTAQLLSHMATPLTVDQVIRRVVRRARGHRTASRILGPKGQSTRISIRRSAPEPVPPLLPPGSRVGEVIKDCTDCPELVLLPKGSFVMGSPDSEKDRYSDEGPTRTVNIGKAIAVGRYEVTRAEFGRFVADSQYKTEAERGNGCAVWGRQCVEV